MCVNVRSQKRVSASGKQSSEQRQPRPQALRFSHRGERETLVTGVEAQGT